ncbi:MAG: FAD-dependent thymidylate synthase [Ginsengibacter sp.]
MEGEKIIRTIVPELDKILGQPFKVLDDGFIRVVDYMGSDESIVQAARVSYGKGTKKLNEDKGLIRYLLRHSHTTPFEMCEIKFHIRVPMDCWRQWIRHRTANVNEYSTRYSIAIDSSQKTKSNEWRKQSTSNKQGSGEFLDESIGVLLSKKEEALHQQIREIYEERLAKNVAREQARKDLPLSTYTEAYWKIDLHNLLHFLALRMDSHAQYEIRSYAEIIGNEIVSKWCPISWEAFNVYKLNAFSFSEIEMTVLKYFIEKKPSEAKKYLISQNMLKVEGDKLKRGREIIEIENKFKRLGIKTEWENY